MKLRNFTGPPPRSEPERAPAGRRLTAFVDRPASAHSESDPELDTSGGSIQETESPEPEPALDALDALDALGDDGETDSVREEPVVGGNGSGNGHSLDSRISDVVAKLRTTPAPEPQEPASEPQPARVKRKSKPDPTPPPEPSVAQERSEGVPESEAEQEPEIEGSGPRGFEPRVVRWESNVAVLYNGDCREVMASFDEASIDCIVTDPPYGLSFMGKGWDHGVPGVEFWAEALRVLKPGGHLLAFGGTRMFHRLGVAIEDAGFELRDCMSWLYGQGFPKSMNVSKAIDAHQKTGKSDSTRTGDGTARDRTGQHWSEFPARKQADKEVVLDTQEAAQWDGWGTAMKPAWEPVIWARKPLTSVPKFDWMLLDVVHHQVGALVWLMWCARRAGESLESSLPGMHGGGCASVLASAATESLLDASEGTDTFKSPGEDSTLWSIVSSWSDILADLSGRTRTFTTSTVSSTTTALRILNSLLAPVTSLSTMPRCGCLLGGRPSSATSVEESSSDEWGSWRDTLSTSVPESAIASIAPVVESALVNVVASCSDDQGEGSSARQSATTRVGGSDDLRPAWEPIVVARKPLEGTVAVNVLEYGTGALNIDATRIGTTDADAKAMERANTPGSGRMKTGGSPIGTFVRSSPTGAMNTAQGRWPANVALGHHESCEVVGTRKVKTGTAVQRNAGGQALFGGIAGNKNLVGARDDATYADEDGTEEVPAYDCHHDCPVRLLDEQSGTLTSGKAAEGGHRRTEQNMEAAKTEGRVFGGGSGIAGTSTTDDAGTLYGDTGGASRFFYQAKASKKEKNRGLPEGTKNDHPTVKPSSLMAWLVRLVCPPGGVVLDPFNGSGSTGVAATEEGFDYIGIDLDPHYVDIAYWRIRAALGPGGEVGLAPPPDAESDEPSLTDVAGIGPKLADTLATRGYPDLASLAVAPDEALLAVPGLGPTTLAAIRETAGGSGSTDEGSDEDESEPEQHEARPSLGLPATVEAPAREGPPVSDTSPRKRKVLDLCSGLDGWTSDFDPEQWEATSLDFNPSFSPTIVADILTVTADDLAAYGPFDLITASPPCEKVSVGALSKNWWVLDNCEVCEHEVRLVKRGKRKADHTWEHTVLTDCDSPTSSIPKSPRIAPKSDGALTAQAIVEHTLKLLDALEPTAWVMENPSGMMKRLDVLAPYPYRSISYCKFGMPYRKRTDLWLGGELENIVLPGPCDTDYRPQRFTTLDDGRVFVIDRTTDQACHEAAPRGAKTGIQGLASAADRALVPRELSRRVREHVEAKLGTER